MERAARHHDDGFIGQQVEKSGDINRHVARYTRVVAKLILVVESPGKHLIALFRHGKRVVAAGIDAVQFGAR